MKKTLSSLLLLLLCSSTSFSQTWVGVGGGINSPIGWTNPSACSDIYSIQVYNGNLYVAGNFDSAGGKPVNLIALWNGTSWSSVGNGIKGYSVKALYVYNGNLYAGGYFDSAGGKPAKNIAMWNGTTWSSVGTGITKFGVNALCLYNGYLIAGGSFDSAGGKSASNIAEWNGTNWSAIGSGVNNTVGSLAIYNSNLYAGGGFDSAGGKPANSIATWNGSIWSTLGSGVSFSSLYSNWAYVAALAVYNDSLYIGGEFDSAGGKPASNLAEWNGTNWSSPFGILSGKEIVFSLCVYDTELCVGGNFSGTGVVNLTNGIAAWDGSKWSSIGGGVNGYCQWCCDTSISVNTMTIYNSALYAGGYFDSISGIRQNSIAMWNGPLGVNEISNSDTKINIYPNPSNGKFTLQWSVVSGQSSVEVYNLLDERVFSKLLIPNSSQGHPFGQLLINLSNQPAGIYFYRVITENGEIVGSGKLIIQ